MNKKNRILVLATVIGQVIVYLLVVGLPQQAFCSIGATPSDAAAISSCIVCPLCLLAFHLQKPRTAPQAYNRRLWLVAIAGALGIALFSHVIAGSLGLTAVPAYTPTTVIGLGIAAPIAEEALYRGIVINRLDKEFSPATTLLLSSMLFAVGHAQPVQIILGFVFGLFLGILYQRSRSLPMASLAHILANLLAFAIA